MDLRKTSLLGGVLFESLKIFEGADCGRVRFLVEVGFLGVVGLGIGGLVEG